MRSVVLLLAAAVTSTAPVAALATPVSPGQINQIVAFGDSLTDPGNASIVSGGADPGPGYATRTVPGLSSPVGYFTNPQSGSGPSGLWIDQFAAMLGVADPAPALAPSGGTNYAFAGALTGGTNPQDMQNQVNLFLGATSGAAPSNDLYTFWGGANDLIAGVSPVTAANNIMSEIEQVSAAGGQNFLWFNLPELGLTPEVSALGPGIVAGIDVASEEFDAAWSADLTTLDALGINVIGVDINSEINNIVADPSAYGFANVTQSCDVTAGCNPNTFLFWDQLHPTTYADSLIANVAYADLTTPTPEPPSVLLLGPALLAMTWFSRARRRGMTQA